MNFRKAAWMIVVTGVSFSLALLLHNYDKPKFDFTPLLRNSDATVMENKPLEVASSEYDKTNSNSIEKFDIFGLQKRISYLDRNVMQTQVESFWNRFYQDKALNNAVIWTSPTFVYALYEDFKDGTANLTIGYGEKQYRNAPTHLTAKIIPRGKYASINVHGNEIISLTRAWNSVSFSTTPSAILEIYKLDEQGEISNIQLKVKY